jgi:hypothetical protein
MRANSSGSAGGAQARETTPRRPSERTIMMRVLIAMTALALAGFATTGAKADPYRWCAQNVDGRGGSNCYFTTIEQCKATASTANSFCTPNTMYTGPDAASARGKHHK